MQINIDTKDLKELQAIMQNRSDRRINAMPSAHCQAGAGLSTTEIQHGINAGIISSTLLIGSQQ